MDVRRSSNTGPVKGTGYFNKSGVGAGESRAMAGAAGPFTTRDGIRTDIDVTAPGYRDAINKARVDYRQVPLKEGGTGNPMWTMPWRQRDAYASAIHGERCYDRTSYDALVEQAELFGTDTLTKGGLEVIQNDGAMFDAAIDYMSANGMLPGYEGPVNELVDTGRYVSLRSPSGEVSQLLMELTPTMDVHRFLDLEAPEGKAQILEFREGDYEVYEEYGDCQMVRDGIEAARQYQDENDMIWHARCGSVMGSELMTQFDDDPFAVDASEAVRPDGIDAAQPADASREAGAPQAGDAAAGAKMTELLGRNRETDEAAREQAERQAADGGKGVV